MNQPSITPPSARRADARANPRTLTLALLVLLAIAACGRGPEAKVPQGMAVPVEMAKVETQPIREVLHLVGTLEANESVLLKPEIAGKIEKIDFKEGERVPAGKLLIQLDDREMNASLREAEADLSFAEADYARKKDLFDQRVISRQELDRAKADLDRLAARVEVIRAQLRKTRIQAPFDGIVGARMVSPGDVVEAGNTLANFEAVDPLKLNFEVPERYLPALRIGQSVQVKVVAFPDRTFTGEVYFIDPRVTRANRSVTVKARVPNGEGLLHPGMFANTELLTGEKDEAITVPEQSLVPQGDEQFVFRVKPDSTVELVPVQTGIRETGRVEILKGLSSGDTVVVSGQQKIGPGSKVMPFGQPPPGGPPGAGGGKPGKPGAKS